MVIGMAVPIILGIYFGKLQMGINVGLGVLFTSISDTTGNLRLNVSGMLLGSILTLLITFLMYFLQLPVLGLLPIIGALLFSLSYLSVYGFRASLISFSGLFAMVLSFSSIAHSELGIFTRITLIALGNSGYIGLVLIRQVLFPKNMTEYYLAQTLKLTADYLKTRAALVDAANNRKELIKKLLDYQKQITDNHETLRELLINRRKHSGKSFYQSKRLLLFRQLVDMLELAMANPVNYYKTDQILKKRPEQLKGFQEVLIAMAKRLRYIATNFSKPRKMTDNSEIASGLIKIEEELKEFSREKDAGNNVVILTNYLKYQKAQLDKINKIERLLKNQNRLEVLEAQKDDTRGFLTTQNYNIKVLIENFNKRSMIFRHSLRIAVVGTIGYGLGAFFNVENAYWILLTVIVIMRPNYGLTKERFKNRTIGTLIGGTIAFIFIMLVGDKVAYAVMAISCLMIGFSMIQRNYKAAVAFITMYVIFVYSLIHPAIFEVIQFRVLDTLIGSGLAIAGSALLWPSWGIKSLDKTLKEAIKADREYLEEITKFYNRKGEQTNEYKLSRKMAFLALSDLSYSFQRMTQEPKRQHENSGHVFRMVMLLNSFLASLASLGTYILNNPTSPASNDFNVVINRIKENLLMVEKLLENSKTLRNMDLETKKDYQDKLEKLAANGNALHSLDMDSAKEEVHLVLEQLKWLLSNSERMLKILKEIRFK